MNIFIKGKGSEKLDKRHYKTSGGEGAIYIKNNIAYKIYSDKSKVIPEAKIQELSVITTPNIIKPERIVIDNKNIPIGYTMRLVPSSISLCQLFTKAFKTRNSINQDTILKLINHFRDTIKMVHSNNILIVDLNEMNFLVSDKFNELYFIDVDSYQTSSFPATAIMESIRDRHCNGKFNVNTDWFSFGIVSFQMFIGIHPYKGKHPKYNNKDSLNARMTDNISVFNQKVSIPNAALPLNSIPEVYKKWYIAIFEQGKRIPPPFENIASVTLAPAKIKVITGTNNFDIKLLGEYDGEIINYQYLDTKDVVYTTKGVYINGRYVQGLPPSTVLGITPKYSKVIRMNKKGLSIRLFNMTDKKDIDYQCNCSDLFEIENRLYLKIEDNIGELLFTELPNKLHVSLKLVSNILLHATQIFDGIVIQNLLGMYYISVFPQSGKHYQLKISELKEYRIIEAKYRNRVLLAVGEKQGKYDMFIIRLNKDYQEYDCRIIKDIQYTGISFISLDNGICLRINEDEHTELFFNKKGDSQIKVIQDTTISGTKLFNRGTTALFSRDNKLYTVRMV
jgi:serine/threonine protein kinase